MHKSRTIRSGPNLRTTSIASEPFEASPQISKPSAALKSLQSACRMAALSSTITTEWPGIKPLTLLAASPLDGIGAKLVS
jgi:hypothetical protein